MSGGDEVDRAILAAVAETLQEMSQPDAHAKFPTVQVLKTFEKLAEANGIDISPRTVPKLKGWSRVGSALQRLVSRKIEEIGYQ